MDRAITVYTPVGRIDSGNAPAAEQEVLSRIEATGPWLVIDLSRIDYLSSAGLRVLLVAAKTCRAAHGSVVIQQPSPAVAEVLQISGFDKILPLVASREEALRALAS